MESDFIEIQRRHDLGTCGSYRAQHARTVPGRFGTQDHSIQ